MHREMKFLRLLRVWKDFHNKLYDLNAPTENKNSHISLGKNWKCCYFQGGNTKPEWWLYNQAYESGPILDCAIQLEMRIHLSCQELDRGPEHIFPVKRIAMYVGKRFRAPCFSWWTEWNFLGCCYSGEGRVKSKQKSRSEPTSMVNSIRLHSVTRTKIIHIERRTESKMETMPVRKP